jgi:hypothetical protein
MVKVFFPLPNPVCVISPELAAEKPVIYSLSSSAAPAKFVFFAG